MQQKQRYSEIELQEFKVKIIKKKLEKEIDYLELLKQLQPK